MSRGAREVQSAGAAPAGWEKDVLPVFYYNDLLISNIGDQIGLNLFEPRYQEMCKRMAAADPRFLFMPNYEDYCCRVGDVGFVVRLTDLQRDPRRGTYGIRGVAEELVAVGCTWAEPGTHNLHYAQVWRLGERADPGSAVSVPEMQALFAEMSQRGWTKAHDESCRLSLKLGGVAQRLILGTNWPDRVFLLAPAAAEGSQDEIPRLLEELWRASNPPSQGARRDVDLLGRLHRVPRVETGLRLGELCQDLVQELMGHPDASKDLGPEVRLDERAWQRLLAEVRLCSVMGMGLSLPTVAVQLECPDLNELQESFPMMRQDTAMVAARVSNGGNVHFCARAEWLRVTAASASQARAALMWRLNRLPLRVVQRARESGHGPLAELHDQVAQLVCDFVALQPGRPR